MEKIRNSHPKQSGGEYDRLVGNHKMSRELKEYKNVNCKVEKSIVNMLEEFTKETGLSKTVTVEKALKLYIEQYHKTGRI